jgi:hypothetical protein
MYYYVYVKALIYMEDLCASGVNPASRGRNAVEIYPPGGSQPFGAVRDGIQIRIVTQLSGFITKLFFDKPTHCRAVSIMASKKADAVFSQKLPIVFNWLVAKGG